MKRLMSLISAVLISLVSFTTEFKQLTVKNPSEFQHTIGQVKL